MSFCSMMLFSIFVFSENGFAGQSGPVGFFRRGREFDIRLLLQSGVSIFPVAGAMP